MRLLLLLTLVLAGCASEKGADTSRKAGSDTLVRLSDAEIRGLDPQKYSDLASLRVARDQFDGLTRYDGTGKAVAAIARGWTISEDGTLWRFTLRDDARFSDGTAITAPLFVALWDRLNADATASPHRELFRVIQGLETEDDTTVTITLAHPYPELPYLLAHPAMAALPMHEIDGKGDDWTAMRPMVTSGAYRLTEWRLNDAAILQANTAWYEADPAIKTVIWKPMDDKLAGMRLVLGGAADIAHSYPDNRHDWLEENHSEYLRSGDYLGSYYFAFNTRKPPFENADVRRALSMVVNRDFLAQTLLPFGNRPACGVVPPALLEEALGDCTGNPDSIGAATALLNQAGYDSDNPLRFAIRINSAREHSRVAVSLAAMWRELPVEPEILNSEATLHFASLRRSDFALARSGWIADLPTADNFLAVHRSNAGPSNYSGYANPAYDALLDRANASPSKTERAKLIAEADTMIAKDAPVLPLYFYRATALVSPRVKGWQDNSLNIHPSATLSLAE
ncbi:peptide ABC transporter substrate-binding protein [Alterisphingorhabdus coralli]|uniref:Peptide ABC transporter substrate-binding protein n=1 Tax=Alterisphingorhabdus coralli TaxID=3071408 RepID=A0AA97F5X0_9SPHN|nr:peptide ABC transporter substrate-binding protein [Parasphingorhabdus sp. SCSIO 66989]WOE74969.1 peptide ABC transporter substrate-binding protein [Parasphingorhabdus sp. SCSIO 66989]